MSIYMFQSRYSPSGSLNERIGNASHLGHARTKPEASDSQLDRPSTACLGVALLAVPVGFVVTGSFDQWIEENQPI